MSRQSLVYHNRCKDYFAADVGHVRRRDSVVGSRSRARARRREEKAEVGRRRRGEEAGDETGTEWNSTSDWGAIPFPNYVHG